VHGDTSGCRLQGSRRGRVDLIRCGGGVGGTGAVAATVRHVYMCGLRRSRAAMLVLCDSLVCGVNKDPPVRSGRVSKGRRREGDEHKGGGTEATRPP
jgi:hypothetical protein